MRFKKEIIDASKYLLHLQFNIGSEGNISYRKKNAPVETGLAANDEGISTNDANEAKSLFPAGGYKGFGLASMIEIFCGIYNGMEYGRNIPPMYTTPIGLKRKLGQFYIVFKPNAVISLNAFLKRMQILTYQVRNQKSRTRKSCSGYQTYKSLWSSN